MFIRIYYEGHSKDINLQDCNRFSIGNSNNDNFVIDNADLVARHAVITNNNGKWELSCNGTIYLNGTAVKNEELKPSQIYILSHAYRISMLVIADYAKNGIEIDLTKLPLRIGREKSNDITLSSPIISSSHAVILKNGSDLTVQDQSSTNGTYVNGNIVQTANLNNGDEIIIGDCKLIYDSGKLYIYGNVCNAYKKDGHTENVSEQPDKVMFKRSPRLKLDVPTGEIIIQSPPNIGTKPEINWLSVFLPSFGTVGVSVIATLLMGMSPTMLAFTAPMSLIGVAVSIINYLKQSKKHTGQEKLRLEKYTQHLDSIIEKIETKQDEQRTALVSANPDINECFDIVKRVDRRLWERRPSDKDFMSVRIGSGNLDFSMTIKAPQKTLSLVEDSLLNRAIEISEKYQSVKDLPITCSILKNSSCGIVGSSKGSFKLLNNILVHLATYHCYTEVKIVFLIDEKDCNNLEWAFHLPHCYDDERQSVYIAKNKKEAEKLFGDFEPLYKERTKETSESHYDAKLQIPYYLFVITSPQLIKGETFNKFLYGNNSEIGLGSIFLYDSIHTLPKECNVIIETEDNEGIIYNKDNASNTVSFRFDTCLNESFAEFGKKIKTIYCDDLNAEATITKSITLYELLKIRSANELNLSVRWNNSNVIKSMAAPLGVKEKNEIVYLDLHEDAHGPHGLVAGTTGSGKSEILQAYILSMATLYHPYEVGFVIIDFKGGGMANQFEELPHLIGAITDIDGKEINRSLLSIRAEIDKRKQLFAENGVNKIDSYIELYKNNKVKTPLPHLIIIVDEFAELKANQPEFMNELISTARIGRSLGIHLILATQKPAGQVNDQIWTNSKFQICLKVQDKTDSQEVIKSPLAAKIKEPGRAYLRVGNDEIFELFQSGYSGAKVKLPDGTVSSQLKEIVQYIKKYCMDNGIKPLLPICLPALPHKIDFNESVAFNIKDRAKIPVGLYDYPTAQAQGEALINLDQNTFVIGAAQTGKTNLLQCIIRTLSTLYSPIEVGIYIIDFASMSLKIFETLHHVGGVVTSDEDEKLKNLFKLLISEIDRRKKRTVEVGVSSFHAYLQAGFTDMERIVVLLDDFVAYKEIYGEDFDDVFAQICKDGITYGISVIATSTQTTGFGYKFLSLFADRVAFMCNDNSEYSDLFSGCRMQPSNIAGRALYKDFDCVLEMQTYLAFKGDMEVERSNSMKDYVQNINEKNEGVYAKKIPCVPGKLTLSYIKQNFNINSIQYEYVIGLNYADVSVVTLDFNSIGELAVVGKSTERKTQIISKLIDIFKSSIIEAPVKIRIIDSVARPLKKYSNLSFVDQYTIDCNEMDSLLEDVDALISERYSLLVNDKMNELKALPLVLIIVNNNDAIDFVSSTKDLMDKYRKASKQMKALKIAFIYSDIDNVNVSFGAPEILKKLKETKNSIMTDDLMDIQFYDIPPNIVRMHKKLQSGDAFFMLDGEIKRMKLIEEE